MSVTVWSGRKCIGLAKMSIGARIGLNAHPDGEGTRQLDPGGGRLKLSAAALGLPERRPRTHRCGSDIRSPGSTAPSGVWTYDFVHDRLADGGPLLFTNLVSF